MKRTLKSTAAAMCAATAVLAAGSVFAGSANPGTNTENLTRTQALKIRLPYGMCDFDNQVPTFVVDKLSERRDWNKLVAYMVANCPELGLPLADAATASIAAPGSDNGSGTDGTVGAADPSAATPGASGDNPGRNPGVGSGGPSTSGPAGDDDDGNNGHGNDADGQDESN
ncbi:MAG: hypothetical protein KJN93_06005, partial [Alphaproteobacteria bacterium]|nr:hypothetical protein [Alphaproteobacteria bacterium]